MGLPFEGTKVPAERSQDAVKKLLYNIGFDAISEFEDRTGRKIIKAQIGKAVFVFEANIEKIMVDLVTRRVNPDEEALRRKARRMGWCSLRYQVKALHDCIKLGSIDIAEGFAGNLILTDNAGKETKMADFIKNGLEHGTLTSSSMSNQFLLEEAKNDDSRN